MKVRALWSAIPVCHRFCQGGHKPGKLREFEISGKTFIFTEKPGKTQGKCKIRHIFVNENVFHGTFPSRVSQGKIENTLEISRKTQGI